jgi:hypothetical protein
VIVTNLRPRYDVFGPHDLVTVTLARRVRLLSSKGRLREVEVVRVRRISMGSDMRLGLDLIVVLETEGEVVAKWVRSIFAIDVWRVMSETIACGCKHDDWNHGGEFYEPDQNLLRMQVRFPGSSICQSLQALYAFRLDNDPLQNEELDHVDGGHGSRVLSNELISCQLLMKLQEYGGVDST